MPLRFDMELRIRSSLRDFDFVRLSQTQRLEEQKGNAGLVLAWFPSNQLRPVFRSGHHHVQLLEPPIKQSALLPQTYYRIARDILRDRLSNPSPGINGL
jgi:hypothetical protein